MNRNDLVAPPITPKKVSGSSLATTGTSPHHHHAATGKPTTSGNSNSSNNNGNAKENTMTSPHSTKSSSSLSHHSFQTPKRTKSGCSIKSAALLEETSVHLSLPSFHTRHFHNKQGGWKCAGCSYENHSTLNNECSVCGMIRNISYHNTNTQQDSFSDDSVSSFMNDSCNSLSLDNSFSITDDGAVLLSKEEINSATAVAGGGVGVGGKGHASMPASAFHNSFSSHSGHSGDRSVRSTRTYRGGRRPPRRAAEDRFYDSNTNNYNNNDGLISFNDSVMSFCHWNGNEKIKPWSCAVCTFLNENPLHLVCEMCGQRRIINTEQPNDTTAATATAAATIIPTDSNSSHDADYCFTGGALSSDEEDAAEVYWLQQEQMRELVELQREIMADFGSRPPSPRRRTPQTPPTRQQQQQQQQSRFNTHDLQRELDQISGLSSPRTAGSLLFGDSDHSSEDDGASPSEAHLKELLAAQKDIMMDFKRKREDANSYTSPVPDKKAASRTITPTAVSKTSASASPHRPLDTMIGVASTANTSIQNTAPAASATTTAVSLKDSMKAAGGKLRHEDLCLPFLWGDTSWYDNNNNHHSSVSKGGANDGTGKGGGGNSSDRNNKRR